MEGSTLHLIGGDSVVFNELLSDESNCFGRRYAASSAVCQECLTPVIGQGTLLLLKEVCALECSKATPGQLKRLTSRDVLERLHGGQSIGQIFYEILNGTNPKINGTVARTLLHDRLWYIKNTMGTPVPVLPPTKELLRVSNQQDD